MSPALLAPGGTGGDSIEFEARPRPPWNSLREIALCDGCGRNFLRHLSVLGIADRNCPGCTARFAATAKRDLAP